jgi:hypothetical protein
VPVSHHPRDGHAKPPNYGSFTPSP